MKRRHRKWQHYAAASGGVAATALLLAPFESHLSSTTVALVLLLAVLFAARWGGSRPALLASVVGMLCFNFFFLPPLHTFTIAAPQNWVALAAFFVTALTTGELSARAERRAAEAEAGRNEIARLYRELQDAFQQASHAEALRQSEKLKSALLDAVSHDIRTPLTAIKASVTTLLQETSSEFVLDADERREMLEVIDEESDRLARFTADLIEMARIEAGAMQLRRRWEPIEEIVANGLARAARLTARHCVETLLETDLPSVRVDPRAIGEVVYTLVDNAAKYAPAGTCITVAAQREKNADAIRFSVNDEGRGVPAELRERIFEKFFRAVRDGDAGPTPQPAGTGLGLAIAKGIVEAHNGRIWLEDGDNGRGARAVFTLPIGDEE